MSYLEHKSFIDDVTTNSYSVAIDEVFPAVELTDALERLVFVTTMDTSAGGTNTACACCPKIGC